MSSNPNINLLKDLNPAQRDAVEYCDGPSLVIASAGSGKTRVLTYKIAFLIQSGYEPWSIMALTFTNKAANVMKERVSKLLGDDSAKHIWMGTFHSVFLKILRFEHDKIGFDSNFTIYDESNSESLIKAIIKELNLDDKLYKASSVAGKISRLKSNLVIPDSYNSNISNYNSDKANNIPEFGHIFKIYVDRCRAANAMDFDDILLHTFTLFQQREVLMKYATRFKYILVDEYQDTNYAQHAIVYLLSSVNRKLCVVGDDAQSIYSFRGANISNILKFNEVYPDNKLFKLEQNYRSTKTIVEAANSVIDKNRNKIEKKAYSENEPGNKIDVYEADTDFEESEVVVKRIMKLHKKSHLGYSSFAILYRTNSQSRKFEEVLRKHNIPYIVYGGVSFYQRKEIRDVLSYFRLVVNHDDEEAFKRIVNFPARGIGSTTVGKLVASATESGKSIWTILTSDNINRLNISKSTIGKLYQFKEMIERFTRLAEETDVDELGKIILSESGIITHIYSDKSIEGQARQENIEELVNAIHEFKMIRVLEGDPNISLTNYLSEVSLLSDMDESHANEDNSVKLMTVHSAKGLEFHTVFVVGMEENIFPSIKQFESERKIEEERRLFYVALTRAEKACYLSYARNRMRFSSLENNDRSRFIKEIDSRYLNFSGTGYSRPTTKHVYDDDFVLPWAKPRQSSQTAHQRPASQYSKIGVGITTAGASSSVSCNNIFGLKIGDNVRHSVFGRGTIVSLDGSDIQCAATVDFGELGQKRLLLKFAKLEKL